MDGRPQNFLKGDIITVVSSNRLFTAKIALLQKAPPEKTLHFFPVTRAAAFSKTKSVLTRRCKENLSPNKSTDPPRVRPFCHRLPVPACWKNIGSFLWLNSSLSERGGFFHGPKMLAKPCVLLGLPLITTATKAGGFQTVGYLIWSPHVTRVILPT